MTKAFLISPEQKSVEPIELSDENEIKTLIGFDTIESDAVGSAGDRLFFDEECFIRGTTGRLVLGLVLELADGIDDLRRRVSFQ